MIKLTFHFRWPVKQVNDSSVELTLPQDGKFPVVDVHFAEQFNLSEREYMKAQEAVIRAVALIE